MEKLSDVLLIIDLQVGVCLDAIPVYRLPQLIEHVNQRIDSYHQAGKNIIFVQHCDEVLIQGEHAWEVIPQLDQGKGTYFV